MSLYEEAKTKVKVDHRWSGEFEFKAGMHQGYVLLQLCLTAAVDIVTELTREGVVGKILYTDILAMMS